MNTAIRQLDRDQWQQAASVFLDYNYRQMWGFGVACAERLGAASEHVAVMNGSGVHGLADVRIKRVPLLGTGVAYVTGGPLVRRLGHSDVEHLGPCLHALIREYVNRRGLVLRILPQLGSPEWNSQQAEVFASCRFHAAARLGGYRTMLVDLRSPLEAVRARLAQKWRNCLNRAEKNGLTVRSGDDPRLFEEFRTLFRELLARKRFSVDLDAGFYADIQSQLPAADRFHVSLASSDGQLVAGHVASILGDTSVYLLGASNQAGLDTRASYLLQWHAIQAARAQGCHWYDLGGIDPEDNPGVYHFKQGMGGDDITAPGPFEMHPKGLRRHIATAAEALYRAVRRLRKA